jgi:hypothetical protein
VGFALQVPWFGAGKTTLRGGYSIQYQRIAVREDVLVPASGGNTRDQQAAITADVAAIIATRAVRASASVARKQRDTATLVTSWQAQRSPMFRHGV